jgi:hypothetical protein
MRDKDSVILENLYFELCSNLNVYEEAFVDRITPNENFERMEEIDYKYFRHVGYNQDADNLKDDTTQKGFLGYGLYNNEKEIVGYLYGYSLSEDEIDPDKIDISSIKIHKNINIQYGNFFKKSIKLEEIRNVDHNDLLKIFNPKNSFYVANFAVETQYRVHVKKLIETFFNMLKQKGIKYVLFDAQPDTKRILLKRWFDHILASIGDRFYLVEI